MPRFMVANGLVEYSQALQTMQKIIEDVRNGGEEVVWFLEHPTIYTAGTSSKDADLLDAVFPVYQSQRGGQYTYHGPGQLVVYVMVDLKKRHNDIRAFVQGLENWVIQTLEILGLQGKCKAGRIGVWLDDGEVERKIAAIGVRVTKGVTWHGLALNVSPDLSHYSGIIPCGLKGFPVTSLKAEKVDVTLPEVVQIMQSGANICKPW